MPGSDAPPGQLDVPQSDDAARSWAAWWDGDDGAAAIDEAGWRRDAEEFVAASDALLRYAATDDVLDVGCGPGFVIEALARRVRSVVGTDVSHRMATAARARCAGHSNVEVVAIEPTRPTDVSGLGARRFSVVLCNSVVQYLRDEGEAEALLRAVRGVCAPGARVLLADLVVGGGRWSDAWGLVRGAWRRGRLREAFRRVGRARGSSYAKTRERLGLLVVDPERLANVARSLGGTADVVSAPLTMLANRRHLFVRF